MFQPFWGPDSLTFHHHLGMTTEAMAVVWLALQTEEDGAAREFGVGSG